MLPTAFTAYCPLFEPMSADRPHSQCLECSLPALSLAISSFTVRSGPLDSWTLLGLKGEGGGWAPPPPRVALWPPPKAGQTFLKLQSSWHRRRRSKILAVSLKHWKGRKGGGGGGSRGGVPPLLLRRTAGLIHHWAGGWGGMPLASGTETGSQYQSAPYQRPLSNTRPPARPELSRNVLRSPSSSHGVRPS